MSTPERLRAYAASVPDVHALSEEEFAAWLRGLLAHAEQDPSYRIRTRIRDLEHEYRRRLRYRERRLDAARAAHAAHPHRGRIEELERERHGVEQGVRGLRAAVAEGRAEPAKLEDFEARKRALEAEAGELRRRTPTLPALERAEGALAAFRAEIGITALEAELADLEQGRGQRASASGRSFEERAAEATRAQLLPALDTAANDELLLLHGVTLGCARAEFDGVVVRVRPGQSVLVLALIEAKRNPNDLAEGFLARQENLAWFTGDRAGYDPALYRTQVYRRGHFDRPAEHEQGGRRLVFDLSSFARFAPDGDAGVHTRGLAFVTEPRPLQGLSSSERSRLLHRIATDRRFRPGDARRVRRWVREHCSRFQTRQLLELYAQDEERARHILLLDADEARSA